MGFIGQITISGSGAAIVGISDLDKNGWILKADSRNTATVWMQDASGSVIKSGSGFPLAAGDTIFVSNLNLNQLSFYVESGSGTICYVKA